MRLISLFLLGSFSVASFAADETVPDFKDAPPPPVLDKSAVDEEMEPQVTIVQKQDMLVEEYRLAGKLYQIKVIPKVGAPYYLVDESGDGKFTRQDGPDAANMRPPRWVIFRF